MRRDTEKEWYYGNQEKERFGPFSLQEVRQKQDSLITRIDVYCLLTDERILGNR